jgi:hypothetical protein
MNPLNIVIAYETTPDEDPIQNLLNRGCSIPKSEKAENRNIIFFRLDRLPDPLPRYMHTLHPDFKFTDEI